ncbi:MAG: hypothetical protein CMP91_10895 [Gammaproteobacteria bacterium]|nr:hypothetical protein [Gammaproteobacteria bacterium]MAY02018.1 hypothetical protein [Gammaproteobacteria bacterium]|tara:strand:- start:1064 stop:1555 length:492 start_codon:yes stop_codon:yes gene_type:complete
MAGFMHQLLKISLLCLLSLNPAYAQLGNQTGSGNIFDNAPLRTGTLQSVMPADSAFALDVYVESTSNIVLNWQIEPGYYLYRKSLGIDSDNTALGTPLIPEGIQTHDEFFGDVEVYYGQLLIRIPYDPEQIGDSITLNLDYQGCAEERYCYPVQNRSITLEIL